MKYISMPDQTPDSRNDDFYEELSHNWKKKAKDLQARRWEKLKHH